jgi:hypothetical protein
VIESGSRRAPVASADSPRQTERNKGTTKKTPAWTRYWKKNISKPPVSCLFRSISGRMSGSSPRESSRACHRKNTQITNAPASMSHSVGDTPPQDGPPGLAWIQPHSLERSTPKTNRPSPTADSTAPR